MRVEDQSLGSGCRVSLTPGSRNMLSPRLKRVREGIRCCCFKQALCMSPELEKVSSTQS